MWALLWITVLPFHAPTSVMMYDTKSMCETAAVEMRKITSNSVSWQQPDGSFKKIIVKQEFDCVSAFFNPESKIFKP